MQTQSEYGFMLTVRDYAAGTTFMKSFRTLAEADRYIIDNRISCGYTIDNRISCGYTIDGGPGMWTPDYEATFDLDNEPHRKQLDAADELDICRTLLNHVADKLQQLDPDYIHVCKSIRDKAEFLAKDAAFHRAREAA